MALEPGAVLGNYDVVAPLGAGGMGEVYRARDRKLGREVALKLLLDDVSANAERLARFEREARVLASLNHPNVATLHGFESVDGTSFLVMELVEGPTLADRIERGPIPVSDAISIFRQIAEGLEAAHEKGIVHRDLKPANVKVTDDGRGVKILDFGLAKAAAEDSDDVSAASFGATQSPTLTHLATRRGEILGTAAYMSPEQAKGRTVDKRTDVCAFGCCLFEALTGERPFSGDDFPEVLASVLRDEPDLGRLPAEAPWGLRRLVERCLVKDPRERLRDIGDARIELRGDLGAPPAEARAEEPRARFGAAKIVAVVFAGLLALVLAMLGLPRLLEPGSEPPPLRKLDLVAEGIDAEWFSAPILSPDGARIAYRERDGLWIRDLDQLEPRYVADASEPAAMFWSPDSSSLGYAVGKKLWRVPADGGRSVAICDLPGTGQAVGGAWREDGLIAIASWRGAIHLVPAEGGRPEPAFEHDSVRIIDYHYPSWLPDGRLLFVIHKNLQEASGGDGSAIRSEAMSDDSAPAVWDGERVEELAWGPFSDISWLSYDPRTSVALYGRAEPSLGVWAREVERESLAARGEDVLLVPDALTLSLGGEQMLYMEGSRVEAVRELAWVDRSGRFLEIAAPALTGLAEPALSPDGRRLALTARAESVREVWIVDLERGNPRRLSFEQADATGVRWAGASELYYSELRGMESTIVMRSADGAGGRRELIDLAGYGMWGGVAAIPPDRQWLLFAVDEQGPLRLRLAPITEDGSLGESRPFFAGSAPPSVVDVEISPDGRLLAYMSTDSGQPELYLTRFPSGEGRWQVSTEGGRRPRWAAESGELFFIGGSGPSSREMTVVEVQSEGEVELGSPRALFPLRNASGLDGSEEGFDVTPDGSRFLLVRSTAGGDGASRMVLVEAWRRELAARGLGTE